MSDKTKQFDALAQRVSDLVGELPNDGKERQMTVTIGGDNHGNITFGNHITIHAAPAAEPEPERKPLTGPQMHAMEQRARAQQRSAFIRSWFNVPLTLMILIAAGVIVALFKGYLWQLINTFEYPFLMPAFFGAVFLPLAYWAARIKRLEQPIIRDAEQTLEAIRHMRHRQRVL